MIAVLWQMAALIALGVVWRQFTPLGLEADATRRAVTGVVYVLFLPALVLEVLWRAPLGLDTVRTALAAAAGVLIALVLAWAVYRKAPPATRGALILATAFGNVTYLGLPVLERTFGPWARGVAIQYDLFACTPLLLTVGILIARSHGEHAVAENPFVSLLKVPPLWAALGAVALNTLGVPLPDGLHGLLSVMAGAVVPLMLVSLGLGLSWEALRLGRLPLLVPALSIRLGVMPLLVWGVAAGLGLSGDRLAAVVLEGAMPSMVLGVVICDRFGLDTGRYAATVTLSTLLSLVTLPLWFHLLH